MMSQAVCVVQLKCMQLKSIQLKCMQLKSIQLKCMYLLARACSRAWRPCCSNPSSFAAPLWVDFKRRMVSKSSSAAVKSQVDLSSLPLHDEQSHMMKAHESTASIHATDDQQADLQRPNVEWTKAD